MLEVRDIHTYYGDSHVLQGVSLKADRGSVVAVLGRNVPRERRRIARRVSNNGRQTPPPDAATTKPPLHSLISWPESSGPCGITTSIFNHSPG